MEEGRTVGSLLQLSEQMITMAWTRVLNTIRKEIAR